jgi:hypothetical protein
MDAGALLAGLKWSELKLITYLYLVPKLSMGGSLFRLQRRFKVEQDSET